VAAKAQRHLQNDFSLRARSLLEEKMTRKQKCI